MAQFRVKFRVKFRVPVWGHPVGQHNDLGDAPNIRHGGVSLLSSFIFDVTAVCSHVGDVPVVGV